MVRTFDGECIHEAVNKYRGESVKQWDTGIGREGRALEAAAADLPRRLVQCREAGRLTLVLGAGVGLSCHLPGWDALIRALFRETVGGQQLRPAETEALLATLRFGDDPLALAQTVTAVAGDRMIRYHLTRLLFANPAARSPLLKALGDLVEGMHQAGRENSAAVAVITFNYDTLLEDELADRGVPVRVFGRGSTLQDSSLDAVNIFHVHGLLSDKWTVSAGDTNVVLTEASYGDAYLRGGASPIDEVLDGQSTPLFVGFSFRDVYVRQALLRARLRRGGPVAVGLLAEGDLIDSRKVVVADLQELLNQDRNPNARAGVRRTAGLRRDTVRQIPGWLARWMMSNLGVEWYRVPTHQDVAMAVSDLASDVAPSAAD